MHKTEKYISYQNSTLSYLKIGEGHKTKICLHGFGQGKEIFESWSKEKQDTTFYSFDLFFHGNSQWKEKASRLDKSFLKSIFEAFLEIENIHKFSLLAFSIGTRYVWTLLELFPEKIENIHLISPDAVRENIWFRIASKTFLGNIIFKFLATKSRFLPKLTALAYKLKIISKSQFRLAQSQMSNTEKRRQVYHTWILLAKLKYDKKIIQQIVAKYEIQFYLYFSENDKIIPPKNLQKFIKNIPCQVFKLKSSHYKVLREAKFLWRSIEKEEKNT